MTLRVVGVGKAGTRLAVDWLEKSGRDAHLVPITTSQDLLDRANACAPGRCVFIDGINCGNNYAKARYTEGTEVELERMFQREEDVEETVIIYSTGGGTGSGLSQRVIETLRQHEAQKPIRAYAVGIDARVSDVVVEPYNAVLNATTNDDLDTLTLFDNGRLYEAASKTTKQPKFNDFNKFITNYMIVEDGSSVDFSPPQGYNILSPGLATLTGDHTFGSQEDFSDFLSPDFSTPLLRGMQEFTLRMGISGGEFNHEGIVPMPSAGSHGVVADYEPEFQHAYCAVGSGPSEYFEKIGNAFDKMFKRKAFLHWYLGEGMDQMEFTEARYNVSQLADKYSATSLQIRSQTQVDDDDNREDASIRRSRPSSIHSTGRAVVDEDERERRSPPLRRGSMSRKKSTEDLKLEVAQEPETQLGKESSRVRSALSALSKDPRNSVALNSATVVCIGAGGSGKTATRRSLQNLAFQDERHSTVGGEQEHLVLSMKKGEMINFKAVDNCLQLKRAVMQLAKDEEKQKSLKASTTQKLNMAITAGSTFDGMVGLEQDLEEMEKGIVSAGRQQATSPKKQNVKKERAALKRHQTMEAARGGAFGGAKTEKKSAAHSSNPGAASAAPARKKGLQRNPTGTVRMKKKTRKAVPGANKEAVFSRDFQLMSQQLTGSDAEEAGVHISFFDMGGQIEFSLLTAPFVRDNNVTVVCFRQDRLLQVVTKQEQTLRGDSHLDAWEELQTWLDVVTSTTTKGPIVLLGTFGDAVSDPADQKAISDFIMTSMSTNEHPAVQRLQEPGKDSGVTEGVCYYPVDNTKSGEDVSVQAFRNILKVLCEKLPTATEKVPVSLLRFHDQLVALTKPKKEDSVTSPAMEQIREKFSSEGKPVSYVLLDDLLQLYLEVSEREGTDDGIYDKEFRVFIDFLHLLGTITHSNAPSLETLVVLDPLWLLQTITRIIRRPSLHPLPIDARLPGGPKKMLFEKGLLFPELLPLLWSELSETLQFQVLGLMLQTGLAVPLNIGADGTPAYLIPSMLPRDTAVKKRDAPAVEAYVAGYTGKRLNYINAIATEDLKTRCRMPFGLFETFVAALARLSQSSSTKSAGTAEPVLTREYASMYIGKFFVEVEPDFNLNCFKLKFHVENAVGLVQQVLSILSGIVEERFVSLRFEILAPFPKEERFVELKAIQQHVKDAPKQAFPVRQSSYSPDELREKMHGLLPQVTQDGPTHIFVSYRHGRNDSASTASFVNALSTQAIGEKGLPVNTFYDRVSLEPGKPFDEAFVQRLFASMLVTPFVTVDALERMMEQENINSVDHVLLEWWLAVFLYNTPGFPIYRIFPVFSGKIKTDTEGNPVVENLFETLDLETIPDQVNLKTHKKLSEFVQEKFGIKQEIPQLTVRNIVKQIMSFQAKGTLAWEVYSDQVKELESSSQSKLDSQAIRQTEVQRVFARCALAVGEALEAVLKQHEKENAGKKKPKDLKSQIKSQVKAAAKQKDTVTATSIDRSEAANWTVPEVVAWFNEIKLAKFAEKVIEHEVTGSDLVDFSLDPDEELIRDAFEFTKLQMKRFKKGLEALFD